MRIITLGSPGSGKKTQTSLLADNYKLTVLTVSELVKQASSEENEQGEQLRMLQRAGQPVTDDIVLNLLQDRLTRPDLSNGFILDGFPRNLLQALTLDELFSEIGLTLDFVLLFYIETDALMERLVGRRTCRSCNAVYNIYNQPSAVEDVCDLCGGRLHQRADDTEETVSSRLHVFDHLTGPLVSHYGKQEKLLRVDGEGEVDAVFARTCQLIDRFLADRSVMKATDDLSIASASVGEVMSDLAPVTPPEKALAVSEQKPAAKKPALKKSVVKSETKPSKAKSTATTNKETAKQPAAKLSASGQKKAAAKKAPAKKVAVSKVVKSSSVVSNKPAKKSAQKPAVKKPLLKKAVEKKPVVKRPATVKTTLKKSASAKKVVKKQVAKKAVVKRSSSVKAKPAAQKKVLAKRQVAKKTASKKVVSKKPKTRPKSATNKKTAAKKAAKRSASRR